MSVTPFKAYYTAKSINATEGSRTAILQDLQPGDVVVIDNDAHENIQGEEGTLKHVTLATAAADQENPAYIVDGVSLGTNELVVGSTTQRVGGIVYLRQLSDGEELTRITGTVARGDNLIVSLHSTAGTGGCLEAATAIANASDVNRYRGVQATASAGTARRLAKVFFKRM